MSNNPCISTVKIVLKMIAISGLLAALNCTKFVFRPGLYTPDSAGEHTAVLQTPRLV